MYEKNISSTRPSFQISRRGNVNGMKLTLTKRPVKITRHPEITQKFYVKLSFYLKKKKNGQRKIEQNDALFVSRNLVWNAETKRSSTFAPKCEITLCSTECDTRPRVTDVSFLRVKCRSRRKISPGGFSTRTTRLKSASACLAKCRGRVSSNSRLADIRGINNSRRECRQSEASVFSSDLWLSSTVNQPLFRRFSLLW